MGVTPVTMGVTPYTLTEAAAAENTMQGSESQHTVETTNPSSDCGRHPYTLTEMEASRSH
jgi:hypothetical protein